ncbi:conserved hypothetical protein [Talaromyces stipitatus ATCC 10500]|uniref:Tat pathway signal sequence n=1 Tax=Talaromyces stipitatus (strain ATCC 10500 / CBS 375.48 / QM 6759 / NRRL 1006) TaxID=441959 RepID=B8MKM8_TALSN|nr:uncharacterized protein TSTA_048260 [Talaromyces stipitatus ATCC 10500]EED15383.1 conserved hypothetical protein [Talaromyces stipitatus ATCC 10500]
MRLNLPEYTLLPMTNAAEASNRNATWQKHLWGCLRDNRSIIHISVLYIAILTLLVYNNFIWTVARPTDPSQILYSPAESTLEYETKVFPENIWTKSPYMTGGNGLPSNETDGLWDDLYKYGIVKVNAEEASNLPNSTAELPHESGFYVIEIDVFHQLHCLNYIRKALYPDRYMHEFRDAYDTEGKRNYSGHDARHYDHCIDSIRLAMMCHADISIIPWQFDPAKEYPTPKLEVAHTCRNFDAVHDWAKSRAVANEGALEWSPGLETDFNMLGGGVLALV